MLCWLGAYLTSAAIGPYLSMNPDYGSSIYLFRVLTVLALPIAVPRVLRMWTVLAPAARALCLTLLAFCFWAPLSATWAPTGARAGASIVAGVLALSAGVIVVAGMARPVPFLRTITGGWLVAFLFVGAAAIAERFFGIAFGAPQEAMLTPKPEAVESTFGNPNNFAAFLLLILALLLARLHSPRGVRGHAGDVALLIFCGLLLVWCQSRTGLLAGLLLVGVALVWNSRTLMRAVPTLVVVIWLALLAVLVSPTTYSSVSDGLSHQVSDAFPKGVELRQEYVRKNLTDLGLRYAADSFLMGQGPGSFEVLARRDAGSTPLDGISNSHNVFVQALAEYGLIVSGPLVAVFALSLRSSRFRKRGERRSVEQFRVLAMCIALIAGGLVASSTLTTPWWWAGVGTLAAFSSVLEGRRRENSIDPAGATDALLSR